MRVIAGAVRGRLLRLPKNAPTRPTSDRIKETLFSMLESLLVRGRPGREIGTEELWDGLRVLDLYAGSGGLGIEALSRGAARATFVETDATAVKAIQANLVATGLIDRALVRAGDVKSAVGTLPGPIDLVLMDPPYADAQALAILDRIAAASWLAPDAILTLEHGATLRPPSKAGNLRLQRDRRHGGTMLTLYARGDFDREGGRGEDH